MFENKNFKTTTRWIIFNKENKILLVKHKVDWKWVLPGWHRENDESPHEALVREIKEEFQINFDFIWKQIETNDNWIKLLPLPLPIDNYIVSYIYKWEEVNKVEYIFLWKTENIDVVPLDKEIYTFWWFSVNEILEENFDCFLRLKETLKFLKKF